MATATVVDTGLGEVLSFSIGPVAVGAYTLTITPISDTGITGTATTSAVTVGGAPLPPTNLAYVSGDITATIISFTASATSGATYNFYLPQEVGSPTFIESVASTRIAGTGALTKTLPALAAAEGDVTVFVTALYNGVESQYAKLTISYQASGAVRSITPNIPSLNFQIPAVTSGRNIQVTYTYDKTNQEVVPTQIQTRIIAEDGTITTQTATNIGAFTGNFVRANLTIASGADGWFRVAIRSKSGAGNFSDWSEYIGPVWCSNVVINPPTNLVVNVV